jgi:branched-chain amino acid transport system permease protein
MAVGLAMVFGILRLINFAHGDVMMVAAYLALFCLGAGLPLSAAIPIMVVGTVAVGLLMERIAYRPLRGAPDVAMLLSSFAVGQILQNGTLLTTRLAGMPTLIAFPSPEQLSGVITIGAITVSKVNLVSFLAGIVLLALLSVFVTRTTLGLSMRAAAEDLSAARLMGIKVNRVVATAFAIGAGLAAVAGFLYAVQAGQVNAYMGFTPVLKAFIAAVIGGFAASPGPCSAATSSVSSRSSSPRSPGSATCSRRVRCRRRSAPFLQQWLRPARWRATATPRCSSCLILVLLVRPQGDPRQARPGEH